jgi:polyisoprenoid-binding protein YceI
MARTSRRPSKRTTGFAIGGVVVVIVVAFLLVYFVFFPTSSPKRFALSAPSAGAAGSTAVTTGSNAKPTVLTPSSGEWTIGSGSQAGYRVREKLAFLPAESDAVGRTSQITGKATFATSGSQVKISAASFKVAVDTLKSDKSMRDEKIHEIGLESNRYPTATFVLSSPVKIAASELEDKVAHVSVTGTFNIHGTSKRETFPVEMSLSGNTLATVGSLAFPWSEFGMTAPSVGGFVNVTDKATLEFDLRFRRA